MNDDASTNSPSPGTGRFATTHWSVVLAAGEPESTRHRQALEALCRTYWFPLYVYLRRQGNDASQAEDYTQAFLAFLLEKRALSKADPKRGRFRSFLLASLKNFLANERARARAHKRGGDRKVLSLDIQNAERRYALKPVDELSPEKLFARSWALTVLDRTMSRLADEAKAAQKQQLFAGLKVYLTADKRSVPYRQMAAELSMSEGAVRVAAHRLRRRYRELLRDEIAQTVTTEEQIDQEIRDLFAALAR
ncbi:MAG: sigma-70 family RNA polymerase sigma factor [Phycisphaerales bacterium]|nr:MAG: sigma-70 family RNA polymerase sigma factor [Phycisphaerales bacterium]